MKSTGRAVDVMQCIAGSTIDDLQLFHARSHDVLVLWPRRSPSGSTGEEENYPKDSKDSEEAG